MSCYQSFPDDSAPNLSDLTVGQAFASTSLMQAETMTLKRILAEMPVHCRQPIINLPARQFLNIYQYHIVAKRHVERREFAYAIAREYQAMSQLVDMMPHHKDHFIYVDMCNVMSTCFLELDGAQGAIQTSQWALGISLKHTPTNYTAISIQYSRLGVAYQAAQDWRTVGYCLTKAIETARLSDELNQAYIRKLEADLNLTRIRIIDNMQVTITIREVERNPGESDGDFQRRTTAEMIAYNAQHGTLQFDKAEFERLPNKQTESQVNDEILKDVLHNLENYVNENTVKTGIREFIAAQFKNTHMKTSPLSPAIIEAALTMIINQMKNENVINDEQYAALKQSPSLLWYRDEDHFYTRGVRVFCMQSKSEKQAEEQ